MGVTMAALDTSEENHRHKERKRVRAHYRFMVSFWSRRPLPDWILLAIQNSLWRSKVVVARW
jgi:hypothetical protein